MYPTSRLLGFRRRIALAALLALLTPALLRPGTASAPGAKLEQLYKLPLAFEVNQGQTDPAVRFLAHGQGYTLFLTSGEAVLALQKSSAKSGVLRMEVLGANAAADISGVDEMAGKSNYFIGNDKTKWRTNVPNYGKVRYKSIYSGIDLIYYGNQRQLEYDFVVSPGADPRRIQLGLRGARKISRSEDGDLVLAMKHGEIRWHRPVVYQEKDGVRQEIAAHYVVKGRKVGFEVAAYDSQRPLFIDPLVLIYSTYLGGSAQDQCRGVAVDSSGNVYLTGLTASTNFPTLNPLQPANAGGANGNAFVAKLNAAGSALVYSTYLGGSAGAIGIGIAVDSSGDAYIAGSTAGDFPTMNALQPTYGGGQEDAFAAKLNGTGSALIYSTYLGGSDQDVAEDIAIDTAGNAYISGSTESIDFPTVNALQAQNGGGNDGFVSKLNPSGSAFVYSTFLGGNGSDDEAWAVATDGTGDAYVTGRTNSTNFPTKNAFQPTYAGNFDVFLSKINPTGSAFVYSTYFGGSGFEEGLGVAVDGSGDVYLTGDTASSNFPTMNPLQPSNRGSSDTAFVAMFNATASALVYSTYLGGTGSQIGLGIAIDTSGNAYVTGQTNSTNFPTVSPLQPANGGGYDAYIAELNPTGSALVWSTYLGGSGDDTGNRIAVNGPGNAYVAGWTASTNFPAVNALQPSYGGGADDGFVAKISTGELSLAPSSGSGASVTFTATYTDPNGTADIARARLLMNTSASVANGCYVEYVPSTNLLYLYNNSGIEWTAPGLKPGIAGQVSNSQCVLNGGSSSVSSSGDTLTLTLSLSFTSTFTGAQNVYLEAVSESGVSSGWVQEGTWTPVGGTGGTSFTSLSPTSGSGSSVIFSATYTDPGGASDIARARLLMNTSVTGANGCYVEYVPSTNHVYLYNNSGNEWVETVLTPGVAGTASNSQCVLNSGASSVSTSGDTLTLKVSLSFTGSFTGAKNVYLNAVGTSGFNSGWDLEGTWTP